MSGTSLAEASFPTLLEISERRQMTSNNQHLTKPEQSDLFRLVRLQIRVKRNEVDEYSARQKAEMELQLAAKYDAFDKNFAQIYAEVKGACKKADDKVAQRCREMGVPASFRPVSPRQTAYQAARWQWWWQWRRFPSAREVRDRCSVLAKKGE
jgi:hypothetical protein